MKITTKGQVTIPRHIRRFLGVSAHSEVDFDIEGDKIVLKKAEPEPSDENRFARLKGVLKSDTTTDEILKMTRGDDWE